MIGALFLFWVFFTHLVSAVFDDEAFQVDWHIDNLGEISCIEKVNNTFVVVGKTNSNSLIISLLNSTSGKALERFTFEDYSEVAKLQDEELFFPFSQTVGSKGSLRDVLGSDASGISCQKPDISSVQFQEGTLRIADVIYDLPDNFYQLEYLNVDPESSTVEILVATTDKHYHFSKFENGEVIIQWERDESLSDVVAYAVYNEVNHGLDLIKDEIDHEQELDLLEAYKFRVATNWERLKAYLILKRFNVGRMLSDLVKEKDAAAQFDLDVQFGLTKQLVVASRSGTITSLDMRSGERLWSIDSGIENIRALHFVKENDLIVVSDLKIYSIDLTDHKYPIRTEKEAPTGYYFESSYESPLIKLVNESDRSFTIVRELSPLVSDSSLVHFEEKKISAFLLKDGDKKPTWERSLKSNEYIAGHSIREDGASASLGVILGNRTVLYKYLNPNVAAYLVANEIDKSIYLDVIDTITGQSLYSTRHNEKVDLNSPINIVVGEHWCVYSYFSLEPIPEQKIAVVEFYESSTPDVRLSTPGKSVDSLTGFFKPAAITKSYFYPQVINSLALSKTKFGITTRSLLLQLDDGSVTYLPRFVINARRKKAEEMQDKDSEEFMAMPYEPTILIDDHFIVSHVRQIIPAKNAKLLSVATNLESTSMICSIGIDIFCTRISPSSQFDKLAPTFEKSKVLITIAVLLVMCFILRPMVDHRKVKTKWMVKNLDITTI